MGHQLWLTDEEVFVVKAALEEGYDSWRKENGPAWGYVAQEIVGGIEKKLPKTVSGMTAETIYHNRANGRVEEELQRLERDGTLTAAAALEIVIREREDAEAGYEC